MTTEMVEIVVSEDQTSKTYYIHKSLLCEKSAYFRRCLASGMQEPNNNKVFLENVHIEAFEVIVHRLYRRGYDKIPDEELPFYWVYNLADRLFIEQLKNAVVNRLMEVWQTTSITAANIVTTFADLYPDTKLGTFLLDQLACEYADGFTIGNDALADLDHDVLLNFTNTWANASKRRKGMTEGEWSRSDPAKDEWCIYHEHNETPWCLDSQPMEAHKLRYTMAELISARASQLFKKLDALETLNPTEGTHISKLKESTGLSNFEIRRRAEELMSKGYCCALHNR
jgi:hypothetical protein